MSTATTIEAVDVEFTSDGSAKSLSDNHHDSEKAVPPHLPALAPIQSNRSLAPEGGLEAWLVVLGAWCCSFCSFGWINSESPFLSLEYPFETASELYLDSFNRCWCVPKLL